MVPMFRCGLDLSNFSFAICSNLPVNVVRPQPGHYRLFESIRHQREDAPDHGAYCSIFTEKTRAEARKRNHVSSPLSKKKILPAPFLPVEPFPVNFLQIAES
ncbi:MAG TPA: hypothetical protein P5219_08020, partial [Aminivibrio sp.]|uniref:hypothetical protein n=1 Tax=Aminivibrio sp. TaxID=1872489 RepID=UPI002C8FB2BD|nr:hypothetical protein [Aminivibrio sp.]